MSDSQGYFRKGQKRSPSRFPFFISDRRNACVFPGEVVQGMKHVIPSLARWTYQDQRYVSPPNEFQ